VKLWGPHSTLGGMEMNLTALLWLWFYQLSRVRGVSAYSHLSYSHFAYYLWISAISPTQLKRKFFLKFRGRMEVFLMEAFGHAPDCFIRYSQSMSSPMESNFLSLTVFFWARPMLSTCKLVSKKPKIRIWYKPICSPHTLSLQRSKQSN